MLPVNIVSSIHRKLDPESRAFLRESCKNFRNRLPVPAIPNTVTSVWLKGEGPEDPRRYPLIKKCLVKYPHSWEHLKTAFGIKEGQENLFFTAASISLETEGVIGMENVLLTADKLEDIVSKIKPKNLFYLVSKCAPETHKALEQYFGTRISKINDETKLEIYGDKYTKSLESIQSVQVKDSVYKTQKELDAIVESLPDFSTPRLNLYGIRFKRILAAFFSCLANCDLKNSLKVTEHVVRYYEFMIKKECECDVMECVRNVCEINDPEIKVGNEVVPRHAIPGMKVAMQYFLNKMKISSCGKLYKQFGPFFNEFLKLLPEGVHPARNMNVQEYSPKNAMATWIMKHRVPREDVLYELETINRIFSATDPVEFNVEMIHEVCEDIAEANSMFNLYVTELISKKRWPAICKCRELAMKYGLKSTLDADMVSYIEGMMYFNDCYIPKEEYKLFEFP